MCARGPLLGILSGDRDKEIILWCALQKKKKTKSVPENLMLNKIGHNLCVLMTQMNRVLEKMQFKRKNKEKIIILFMDI